MIVQMYGAFTYLKLRGERCIMLMLWDTSSVIQPAITGCFRPFKNKHPRSGKATGVDQVPTCAPAKVAPRSGLLIRSDLVSFSLALVAVLFAFPVKPSVVIILQEECPENPGQPTSLPAVKGFHPPEQRCRCSSSQAGTLLVIVMMLKETLTFGAYQWSSRSGSHLYQVVTTLHVCQLEATFAPFGLLCSLLWCDSWPVSSCVSPAMHCTVFSCSRHPHPGQMHF